MRKTYTIPISAFLLIIALPTIIAFLLSIPRTGEITQFGEDLGNFTIFNLEGKIQGMIIFAICGIITVILGIFGIKVKFK